MLQRLFESTVSALCYEIAGPYNDVARFVMRQHANMPCVLGWGVRLGTLLFAAMAVPRHGTVFHRLSAPRRRLQVDAWTVSRLAPCRDLMKFYASLAIFALHSLPSTGQAG